VSVAGSLVPRCPNCCQWVRSPSGSGSTSRCGATSINSPFNVLEDGATVADPHEVTDAMVSEFVAIRQAAGLSPRRTEVSSALV
jgi:hypothetical protein